MNNPNEPTGIHELGSENIERERLAYLEHAVSQSRESFHSAEGMGGQSTNYIFWRGLRRSNDSAMPDQTYEAYLPALEGRTLVQTLETRVAEARALADEQHQTMEPVVYVDIAYGNGNALLEA